MLGESCSATTLDSVSVSEFKSFLLLLASPFVILLLVGTLSLSIPPIVMLEVAGLMGSHRVCQDM